MFQVRTIVTETAFSIDELEELYVLFKVSYSSHLAFCSLKMKYRQEIKQCLVSTEKINNILRALSWALQLFSSSVSYSCTAGLFKHTVKINVPVLLMAQCS